MQRVKKAYAGPHPHRQTIRDRQCGGRTPEHRANQCAETRADADPHTLTVARTYVGGF